METPRLLVRRFRAEDAGALIAEAKARGVRGAVIECVPAQTAMRRIAEKYGFAPAGEANGLASFRKRFA